MLIETAIASTAISLVRKGKIRYLIDIYIYRWAFLLMAGLLHFLLSISFIPETFRFMTIMVIYVMILLSLLFNYRRKSMRIVSIGVFLNFAVIAANNGYMPVSYGVLKWAGYEVSTIHSNILDPFHSLITVSTHIPFLADIIPIPEPYPFPQILSVGDCFIMVGVFLFFQNLLVRRSESKI